MLKITVDGVANVETKTFDDVRRVVEAGKPAAVVERFAAMYLESLDPNQKLKERWYASHSEIERLNEIVRHEDKIIDNEDGTKSIVVVKQGRELTAEEQEYLGVVTENRTVLEDGYTVAAVLDDEGVEVTPEQVIPGTPWLATLRGAGVEPVPEFTPQNAADWLASTFPEIRKTQRDEAVKRITVTTTSSKEFDGDERSQDRMARAVALGQAGDTTQWKLADNSIASVTWEELREALYLAGQAQTAIWMA